MEKNISSIWNDITDMAYGPVCLVGSLAMTAITMAHGRPATAAVYLFGAFASAAATVRDIKNKIDYSVIDQENQEDQENRKWLPQSKKPSPYF
ncbi:MAG TPA: hypothetical protein VIF12_00680 [Micavibrio sp.]